MAAPHYQIIRRPIITEKGLGVKEVHHTVVFEVAAGATKTEIKEAVQQIFKVKVADVRTANFVGKMRRRGQRESVREAGGRRKDDRVRREFVTTGSGKPPSWRRDLEGKRQRWD
jgi:large subunit ribosomal protein L23